MLTTQKSRITRIDPTTNSQSNAQSDNGVRLRTKRSGRRFVRQNCKLRIQVFCGNTVWGVTVVMCEEKEHTAVLVLKESTPASMIIFKLFLNMGNYLYYFLIIYPLFLSGYFLNFSIAFVFFSIAFSRSDWFG